MMAVILVGVSWRLREHAAVAVPWPPGRRAPADGRGSDGNCAISCAPRGALSSARARLRSGVVFAVLPLGSYALSLSLQSNLAVELGLGDQAIGTIGLGRR